MMTTMETGITLSTENGKFELSIPRIPGVRSEIVARIVPNTKEFTCALVKFRRETDGQEYVLNGMPIKTYGTPEGATRAARKFLEKELARTA